MHANLALTLLNNAFDDGKPEADALLVLFGCPLKLAKAIKKFCLILWRYSHTSVPNLSM